MNRYAQKLADSLLDNGDGEAFLEALLAGRSAAPALLWMGERPDPMPFEPLAPAPWQPDFTDRISPDVRAGRHELHARGAYYCLDLSSVFEATPLLGLPADSVLDLCAAPGGKSLFAWRALAPMRLVSNEVIGKRHGALRANLARCGAGEAEVARLDPSAIEDDAFSLVLVDAPCSGQSLLARGQENPGAFHPVTVKGCAGRQKRIVAEAARAALPGGHLLYSTCTFSREENEEIIAWLLARRDDFSACEVPALAAHRSPHADFPAYRLWPQEGFGAGGFTCLLNRRV